LEGKGLAVLPKQGKIAVYMLYNEKRKKAIGFPMAFQLILFNRKL